MALLRAAAMAHPCFLRWWWMLILLFVGSTKLSAQTAVSAEYQVKAVFLFNFARFVDWPVKAFPDTNAPFVIGVLGDDPFGSYLDETVRGERVNGHPLTVQRYRRASEIKACQVLFIGRSESDRLDQILGSLRGRSILTVGETDDFATHGGMIRLATEKNKVRMYINRDAAKAANLKISSKLLQVAEVQR
jgi:YfiR/HmsC-like